MTNKGLLELVQKEGEILKATMTDFEDPAFTTWHTKLVEIMAKVYGEGTREYDSIAKMAFGPTILSSRTTDQEILEECKENIGRALAKLAAYISLMDIEPVTSDRDNAAPGADNNGSITNKELLESLYERGNALLSTITKPSEEHLIKEWREDVVKATDRIFGERGSKSQQVEQVGTMRWQYVADDKSAPNEITEWLNGQHEDIKDVLGLLSAWINELPEEKKMGNKVFIVYGHDEVLKLKVENLLLSNSIEHIILDKEANMGRTLIEKFEDHADEAGCAICLLTSSDDDPTIRDNVIFEMGYFAGRLGRKRVITISTAEDHEQFPSDIQGLCYVPVNRIEVDLLKELTAMGIVPMTPVGGTPVKRI